MDPLDPPNPPNPPVKELPMKRPPEPRNPKVRKVVKRHLDSKEQDRPKLPDLNKALGLKPSRRGPL